jgi:two-component system CheB/CheR fusion protein
VSDTGKGIDPKSLEQVFNMFEQGEGSSSTRREGGLGIGLALVKQLTELHDGRVEARSAGLGKGAMFLVWLPLFEGRLGGRSHSTQATLLGRRVLLVEDDVEALDALGELLRTEGAQVTATSSAQEALRHAEATDFDLVISDIAMPDMNGLQLLVQLRRQPRSAAWLAIAVTGFGRPGDAEKAVAAGFDAHLTKPLSLDALHDTYDLLVRQRQNGPTAPLEHPVDRA